MDDDEDDEEEEEDEFDPEPEVGTQEHHDWSVRQFSVPDTDFYCYLDLFTQWNNGYFFWAGHDCDIYDLTLTVMASDNDWDNNLTYLSSDAIELGCQEIGAGDRACNFFMTPDNGKFGI